MYEHSHSLPPSDVVRAEATKAQIVQLRNRLALHTSAFDFTYGISSEPQWPSAQAPPSATQQVFARQTLENDMIADAQLHLTDERRPFLPLHPYGWMIGRGAIHLARQATAIEQLAALRYQIYSSGHTDFSAHLAHMDDPLARKLIGEAWDALALEKIPIPHEPAVHIADRQVGPLQVQAFGTYVMGLLRST